MKVILILKKRPQDIKKNKEENLDIVSSQGYCAIKDPRLEWQKYPQCQSINQMLYKERKVCLCSNSSSIVEADVAICFPVLQIFTLVLLHMLMFTN